MSKIILKKKYVKTKPYRHNVVSRFKDCTVVFIDGKRISMPNIGHLSYDQEIKRTKEFVQFGKTGVKNEIKI